MAKKYYWLKLRKDFFKRHDIRIIEDMPNGKDYILFYMKLLLESIDHYGELRFSETIPYNDSMLSTITNTNIDIVRSAIKIFSELQMMEIMDNGTIYMSQVNQMLGYETEWAEKKRVYRKGVAEIEDKTKDGERTKKDNVRQELDIELDIDKDIIQKESAKDVEQRHKYGEYKHVLLTDTQYNRLLDEWGQEELEYMITVLDEGIQMKGYKYIDFNLALRNWKRTEDKRRKKERGPRYKTIVVPDELKGIADVNCRE